MKKTTLLLLLSMTMLAAMPAMAQSALPPVRHAELNRVTQTYERQPLADEEASSNHRFAEQCQAVIGISAYCTCLAHKLPEGLEFGQYATVLSRTKEQNNYSALSAAAQRTYDALPSIRDECAAVLGAP